MKAGQTAVALIIIGAIAMAGITAEDSEASSTQYEVIVWLYHESGTLWKSETVTPGTTLKEIFAGGYGTSEYWVDVCTGYEWAKDKPIN